MDLRHFKEQTMVEHNDALMDSYLQDIFQTRDGLKPLLEHLINRAMEAEVAEHLSADHYQRSDRRRGYRNGSKPRSMSTRVGKLDLAIPQVRGCEPYHPSMFNKFQRSERALLTACAEMYFQGVSTRRVQNVLHFMCGSNISSSTVSCIAAELDQQLKQFRSRRLDEHIYPFLQIDARYEKIRIDGRVVSQAVLVAMGINEEGERQILDWRIADSESQESWSTMFRHLKDRGLQGLEMVVSDAHSGIVAAIRRHFQGVTWQRCRVHFKRELAHRVPHKLRRQLMQEIAAVFAGENQTECLRRGREMADNWHKRYRSIAKMLNEGLEDCLAVMSLPEQFRRKMNSTNMIENVMKQLRQRTKVISLFPNRASCDRLIGAHLLEIHEKWSTSRPYLNMNLLIQHKNNQQQMQQKTA
jgi:transposase-like protein